MNSGTRPGQQDRPDLIARADMRGATQWQAGRGKLRTYLGIAPGVGKTYAMLRDGRARRRSGVDTVVAHWERHGRPATAAQLGDLEVLPARTVTYRGASFAELDVAAVLDRRPRLAVVDELAHANLPGERHARRWQDVGELLAGGIDVYTTLNVANIESLSPGVSRITGVRPAEPVPDEFVRAGQITLVDLAPSALRRRLAQGLVVPAERVDAALSSYFRLANLAGLRELTQLWLDDRVPDPVTAFLAARGLSGPANAVRCRAPGSARPGHRQPGPAADGAAGEGPSAAGRTGRDVARDQVWRPCFGADPRRPAGRRLPACDRVVSALALVAPADRVHGGGPGAPRGWRPARPGRERRAAGQDQRRVAPSRT